MTTESEKIDEIFSGMISTLDSVLPERVREPEAILNSLISELKFSVNQMVLNKPNSWKIKKEVYVEVLKMISEMEKG